MATLENWFEKKDYEEGLILLTKLSKNRALIQNLGKKKNPDKLKYELSKFRNLQKPVPVPAAPKDKRAKGGKKDNKPAKKVETKKVDDPENPRTVVGSKGLIEIDKLPFNLKKLWYQARDAYKEQRALCEKLKLMDKATDEDRRPLTERVSQLDDLIRDNWAAIDAWDPNKVDEGKHSEKIDHKRINANRKFISTNLKKLQDGIEESKAEIIRDNLKLRYEELMKAGEEVEEKTIAELKKFSVI